ncbi:MAG: hypothetical protein ACK4SS_00510, partial [Cypionkella sp.]
DDATLRDRVSGLELVLTRTRRALQAPALAEGTLWYLAALSAVLLSALLLAAVAPRHAVRIVWQARHTVHDITGCAHKPTARINHLQQPSAPAQRFSSLKNHAILLSSLIPFYGALRLARDISVTGNLRHIRLCL